MKTKQLLLLLFMSFGHAIFAQETAEVDQANLRAILSSIGPTAQEGAFLSYRKDGVFKSLIHTSHQYLAGINTQGEISLFTDNIPFPGPDSLSIFVDEVFQVTGQQIEAHLADFEDGTIDNPIPAIYGWPARENTFFEEYHPDLELPNASSGLAPFFDVGWDGAYNPDQGDYPILEIRGCNEIVIPSQMYWVVYRLGNQDMGDVFQVELTLFSFGCEESNPLNNTIFSRYKIKQLNDTPIGSMYLGLFIDPDLGCFTDDYVGTFPERHTAFAYNNNAVDGPCENPDDPSFGENPPVVGVDLLRGPLDEATNLVPLKTIRHYFNASFGNFPPGTTDPNSLTEYYNYLQGLWRDGVPLTIGGLGYLGGDETNFSFPGLPDDPNAWTELQEENPSGDRKLVASYGPYVSLPGSINELVVAYQVYDEGTDYLAKVEGLRDQVDIIQSFYNGCFVLDNDILPPCTAMLSDVEEVSLSAPKINIFPNPARSIVTIQTDFPIGQIRLINMSGQLVKTAMENEIEVAGLPAGIYILEIHGANQVYVEKVVVE